MGFRKKNANEILIKFNTDHPKISISKEKIFEILYNARIYIAFYYKDKYILEDISTHNKYEYFSVDESDFVKINGIILWVIGVLNNNTYELRLEVSYTRTEEVLKKLFRHMLKLVIILLVMAGLYIYGLGDLFQDIYIPPIIMVMGTLVKAMIVPAI